MKKNIFLLILSILVFSCKKESNETSVETTIRISEEAAVIVDSYINEASSTDGFIDPEEIANEIRSIKDVKSATVIETGTGIILEQKDGTFSNVYILTEDDERLFKTQSKTSVETGNKGIENSKSPLFNPTGNKKALILAPFQSSMNSDLNKMTQYLELAGYTVEKYLNAAANLERFRGSFLNDYDIVLIRTHGKAHFYTTNGIKTTILTTGERINRETYINLTDEERHGISYDCTVDGTTYFGIGVPWLNVTTDEKFTNSWIFAGACESSYWDGGSPSLSEAFLELGAGGYNGWDYSVYTDLDNLVSYKMTDLFTSGLSFLDASNEVRSEQLLEWRTILDPKYPNRVFRDVGYFDSHQKSFDAFYLIDKGSAPNTPLSPNPSHGATGVSTSPALAWTCSDPDNDPLTYDVYFGTTNNPTTLICTSISAASVTRNGLNHGVTYYWRVEAKDNHGNSTSGPIWRFTTISNSGTIPTNGLVAYYPFNGNANDFSGNNNHGTPYGAALTSDRHGIPNSAYLFDGIDDYIRISHSQSLNLSQQISISFWARLETSADYYMPYHIIEKFGSWGSGQRGNDLNWGVETTNGAFHIWSMDLSFNRFYHFVHVYDGSRILTYCDGTLRESTPADGNLIQNTNPVYISRYHQGGDYYFDGTLDDFRIYNRALTQQEITALFNE
jgi:hypothetical protein